MPSTILVFVISGTVHVKICKGDIRVLISGVNRDIYYNHKYRYLKLKYISVFVKCRYMYLIRNIEICISNTSSAFQMQVSAFHLEISIF